MLGMSEHTIRKTLSKILVRAGLSPYFNIVLFGSDASTPHGVIGESRQLQECEFILIDVGAVFHGYSSDITRTFLPRRTDIEECEGKMVVGGKYSLEELWSTVYDAQSAAIEKMRLGSNCSDVDLAARGVVEEAGLGEYFSHRLGHGLGIEGHERYNTTEQREKLTGDRI
jgi:Xaa-Pro aminopeptidase